MDKLYKEAITNAGSVEAVLTSPADIFAVCAKLAKVTGCYLAYAASTKSHLIKTDICIRDGESWSMAIEKLSSPSWSDELSKELPKLLVSSWKSVGRWLSTSSKNPNRILSDPKVVASILYLIAAADEACAGLGLPDGGAKNYFGFVSNARLSIRGTLCRFLSPVSVRIIPKQHTPKFGLNLRNLTHHLALCEESEVAVKWNQNPVIRNDGISFDILLVPWPFEVLPSDVKPSKRYSSNESVGYFDYSPKKKGRPVQEILKLVKKAQDKGQKVDLVVLPECAIEDSAWKNLSAKLAIMNIALLSGVSGQGASPNTFTNSVRLKTPGSPGDSLTQFKHHRWKIEKSQIQTYGLGGTLDCSREWWENVEIKSREVNFFAFTSSLVLCPLICEDLARQDPVADIVRSVGPNLVIALLMDGPQLSSRWSARYASVLADDPGSSVLTISSLGMVKLSRPPQGGDARQVIASWKDSQGSFVEISLPAGLHGVLLNLQFSKGLEQTVDGRRDAGVASTPVLAGIHYI